MRKIILSVIGVIIIVASVFIAKKLIANKNKPKPVIDKIEKTVLVDTVKNTDVLIKIPVNGSLVAKRRLELYSEVQGVLKTSSILFKTGQKYSSGQVLLNIDASEYYASVQVAKTNLYNAIVSAMTDLRIDYPEVYPKWQDYLKGFDLNKSVPKLPEITSDKENYFIISKGITSGYYNVKNLEQRLSKYIIKAPFSGVLTEALVTEGTLIRNGQKLGEFIDASEYEMQVSISKSLVHLLKIGEEVELNTLDKTETYKGVIARINGKVDQASQTVMVFISVKDSNLKEGLYLEAIINGDVIKDAIEIDRGLLLDDQQIFAVKHGVLELIDVKPVYFSESKVVLQGVANGTVILSKPIPGAYIGMQVKTFSANN